MKLTVQELLGSVRPEHRAVLVEVYLNDRTAAAAAVLGIPVGSEVTGRNADVPRRRLLNSKWATTDLLNDKSPDPAWLMPWTTAASATTGRREARTS